MKKRLDITLVEKGLARSRTQAAELVRGGNVLVDGTQAEKPSLLVDESVSIEVTAKPQYVGRGGTKLAHALEYFNVDVQGLVVADVGSSTGGFTDCVLQRGAKKVFAIDVGHSQLVPELLSDPRVVSMENTDVRTAKLPLLVDLVVVDVSFISVTNIFPAIFSMLIPGGQVIVLIKPQFEVGKGKLGKHGVVKDEELRAATVEAVIQKAQELGFVYEGITDSPILGGEGNKEYLAYFKKQNQ